MILESDRITFPFHFPAIPLAHHEDMPEALLPVEFEGDHPISIEFVGVTKKDNTGQVTFRWTNHTNKDVHAVETKVDFLDADGVVLKERNMHKSADRILLEYGETKEMQFFEHSVPDGTVSVRGTLKSIEFADTTKWSAVE